MNNYFTALRARHRALRECEQARRELHGSVEDLVGAYETRPLPILAGVAGIGFVLAQMRVGSGLVKAGARIATGPAWGLIRQFVDHVS
ncbi:MAG TPA: hypothetical protein VJ862_03010 [Rhodanobacteraceae bacterium]|nr:hypothetical protein [Rhodanobacteraceae bacterium]